MKIVLENISKRYTTQWILKKISHEFNSGVIHSIQGRNGSGKSTLMQILSTKLSPTLGKREYYKGNQKITESEDLPFQISFAAPYIFPLEDLSIKELFSFHNTFRSMREGMDYSSFLEVMKYPYKEDQLIKYFSSGMKQRLSLAMAILTQSEIILLDEPTSYLDLEAKKWYHDLLIKWQKGSTVIISTNDKEDLKECTEHLFL